MREVARRGAVRTAGQVRCAHSGRLRRAPLMALGSSPAGSILGRRRAGGAEPAQRLVGCRRRPAPGDADDALAVVLEQRLALGVVFTGDAVLVPGGAVGLDARAAGPASGSRARSAGPRARAAVDVRTLEPAAEHEVEHHVLELAPRRGGAGGEQTPASLPRPRHGPPARAPPPPGGRSPAAAPAPGPRRGAAPRRQRGGQVDERPGRRGHGDAGAARQVVAGRAPHDGRGPRRSAACRILRGSPPAALLAVEDLPERGRRDVAEHRARPHTP